MSTLKIFRLKSKKRFLTALLKMALACFEEAK